MIVNDGFEDGFYAYEGLGELTVPAGWKPVWAQGTESGELVRPEWKPAGTAQIRTGMGAVACHSRNATIDGALYKKFAARIGTLVVLSAWCMKTEKASGGGQVIGIDPFGGEDHTDARIVWSDWYSQYVPDYVSCMWRERTVEAVAEASQVTVFLRSKVEYKADGFNTHFDDLKLILEEGPTPPPDGAVDYDRIRRIVREEVLVQTHRFGEDLLELMRHFGESLLQ